MIDNLINFLHLLAAAAWIGGALFTKIVLAPALAKIDRQQSGIVMGFVAKRFSIVAWTSIVVLIITGLLKTPSDMLFDTSSDIGIFLTIKLVSVIAVLIIGLFIGLKIVPAMRKVTPAPGEKPSDDFVKYSGQLDRLALINTILGVLILLWASFLW